ncbi:putative holin-like toxin [Enterococcus sp. HY326]|nr:putative holin-like toxin [Enterococcus sp. HY326]
MTTFEAIQLMIAFATLVLLILDHKKQKNNGSIIYGTDESKLILQPHKL